MRCRRERIKWWRKRKVRREGDRCWSSGSHGGRGNSCIKGWTRGLGFQSRGFRVSGGDGLRVPSHTAKDLKFSDNPFYISGGKGGGAYPVCEVKGYA